MTTTATICPRCLGYIPSNERPGAYIGAMSRADNATMVCSACGTEEAMLDFANGEPTPIEQWPVVNQPPAPIDGFAAARTRHLQRLELDNDLD